MSQPSPSPVLSPSLVPSSPATSAPPAAASAPAASASPAAASPAAASPPAAASSLANRPHRHEPYVQPGRSRTPLIAAVCGLLVAIVVSILHAAGVELGEGALSSVNLIIDAMVVTGWGFGANWLAVQRQRLGVIELQRVRNMPPPGATDLPTTTAPQI